MSREARAGLLVAVSILVLFAGFYFLKGADILSRQYEYHAFYDNVQGLQPSAPVQIRGLEVGKVKMIRLNKNQLHGKIEVIFGINRSTRLPVGTVAKLASLDLLGNKAIALDLGTSSELLDDDATVPAMNEAGLVDKLSAEATPLIHDVRKVVNSIDSVLNSVNMIFSPKTRDDLQKSVAALHNSLDNLSSLSKSLESQRQVLNHVIQNADKITTQLANSNLDGTLNNFNKASEKIANAPIDQTLKHLDEMSLSLNEIVSKINNNEGSLGMLVHDKELYENLNKTLAELSKLTADLKAHPSRYINLTIFGRKAQPASN
jgi:phospholipid/cholesterol/gamma-HCH transport system substrate-binding protein